MTDIWWYSCPYGHRTVSRIGGKDHSPHIKPQWRCATCMRNDEIAGHRYPVVLDLKTDEEVKP